VRSHCGNGAEFLELVSGAFPFAPASDSGDIDAVSPGDGQRRGKTLTIGPVIERGQPITAGIGG
jgi:hypothetical protein